MRQFSFAANAYDAAWMVSYGAAWSLLQEGEVSSIGIARGLRQLSAGALIETRPTTWNQVISSFRSGNGVNITGASGELDYDPATEETTGAIEIWRIEGGEIVGVDTWPPTTSE